MAINGKVALVTGAAQGIGEGIALRLAKDGADICLVDMNEAKLAGVADQVKALGRKVTTFVADVSDRDQVFAAVEHAEKELGAFDIMVNNAGIAISNALLNVTPEEFDRIFKVNTNGVLWGIQAAAKKFIAREQKGKIINAASIAAHDGFAMLGAYSSTKFAVRALTQVAARELACKGITVNAYCPGIVDTSMWLDIDKGFVDNMGTVPGETYKQFCDGIALGRPQTAEDVANFVSHLACSDSDYMTGQCVIIDGGIVYR